MAELSSVKLPLGAKKRSKTTDGAIPKMVNVKMPKRQAENTVPTSTTANNNERLGVKFEPKTPNSSNTKLVVKKSKAITKTSVPVTSTGKKQAVQLGQKAYHQQPKKVAVVGANNTTDMKAMRVKMVQSKTVLPIRIKSTKMSVSINNEKPKKQPKEESVESTNANNNKQSVNTKTRGFLKVDIKKNEYVLGRG